MEDYEREAERHALKHRMLARIMTARTPRELVLLLMQEDWEETSGASISSAERQSTWEHRKVPFRVKISREQGRDGFYRTRVTVEEKIWEYEYE